MTAPDREEVVAVAITFDPFRELDRLSQLLGGNIEGRARWMPMDLYRSGDHYVVNVDLPGVDPGSIDLSVEGDTLTIRAQRTLHGEGEAQWLTQERPAGSFMRQLTLGQDLDVEGIHAHYEHGVLSLTIPVSAAAKPRKIAVESRGGAQEIGSGPQGEQQSVSGEAKSEGSTG